MADLAHLAAIPGEYGGDDRVAGGPGADVASGGPGADRLAGDTGADHLEGAAEATGARATRRTTRRATAPAG